MGKRKDRRFAANNTSRRVKLDLYTEPTCSSDVRDEGVVEREPNNYSGSGQKTENPLLLLGEYSDDDEVEDDSDEKKTDFATVDTSIANKNEVQKVDGVSTQGHKDTNIKSDADTDTKIVEKEETGNDSSTTGIKVEVKRGYAIVSSNSTISDGLYKQTEDPSVQPSGTVSLENYAPIDVSLQWKMILHEESNQYYYWNTVTGETSWEIPSVFTQTAYQTSYLQPYQEEPAVPGTTASRTVVGTDVHQAVNYQPHQEELAVSEASIDLPSRLLTQSEGLMEKLRSLKMSDGNVHNNEKISKYTHEVEVRHSDIKALISDTSSSPLLSFWLHTEKQLKRLEECINDEIYQLAKCAVMDEVTETNKSSPKDKSLDVVNTETESEEEGELVAKAEVAGNATSSGELLPKAVASPVVEDIDMDVDMEVEESVPLEPSSNLKTDVPPPPVVEWVPPPPSESEDVPPPPPPDSYIEPTPPPPLSSDSYTVPQSYIQQPEAQYNLTYPESSYQYITDPNTQFYGSQVSVPQSGFYYETVPTTSEVAPTVEAYYDTALLFPVISSVDSSSLHHQSGVVGSTNYNIPSNPSTALEPSSRSNDSSEKASSSIPSQSTDVKAQPKVKRTKKRIVTATSTLRSNKKVSSLVDKWKAAKEELNDSSEEEEEEDGFLDRKRRREIEEWKSRQIASGEAKENANFQPLGGDWRAKVKRRKEQAGREVEDDSTQQKPDLTKLSAQLPTGWQAYWDESTKKVYYGNRKTSQTSWTLPTST